jgi:eukaryotic-like serine/threonine-protein kinase
MLPNQSEKRPLLRQDKPPFSEDLQSTVFIPRAGHTPIDGLGGEYSPIEVELPEVGSEFGRYRLQAIRAMGSGSVVFRAQHRALGIPVALKFLNRRHFSDRLALLEQLRLEATLLARISHRNIVRLWDFDDDFDHAYLATEYIEGPTLMAAIQDQGRIERKRAVRIVLQVIDALESLTHLNVVHRDVKPDNILLSATGTVKLIDLGLAMIIGEEIPQLRVISPVASWVGTPSYLAPEQARSTRRVDFRADIYSLGATLFQCLTGRLPFQARTATQMVLQHLERQPPNPNELNPEVGEPLAGVVLKMMAKSPAARFANYPELRQALIDTL